MAAAPTASVLIKASLVGDDAGSAAVGGVRDVLAPIRPANFASFKRALVGAFPGLDAAAVSLFVLFPGPGAGGALGVGGRLVEVEIDADSDVEALKCVALPRRARAKKALRPMSARKIAPRNGGFRELLAWGGAATCT